MDITMYERIIGEINTIHYKMDKLYEGLGFELDEKGNLIILDEKEENLNNNIEIKNKESIK